VRHQRAAHRAGRARDEDGGHDGCSRWNFVACW
jgi:hypothetical protein